MSEPRIVLLNDLPYGDGHEDPRESLPSTLAFAVDDWSASRAMAWVYGIVMGWDGDGPVEPEGDAMAELAETFGWDDATVARLRRLHVAFDALRPGGSVGESEADQDA